MKGTPNGACIQAHLTFNFNGCTQINAKVEYFHKGHTKWSMHTSSVNIEFYWLLQNKCKSGVFHKGHTKWSMYTSSVNIEFNRLDPNKFKSGVFS